MNANHKRVLGLRSSNASSAIPARKVKRQRTRANVKRAALREWSA